MGFNSPIHNRITAFHLPSLDKFIKSSLIRKRVEKIKKGTYIEKVAKNLLSCYFSPGPLFQPLSESDKGSPTKVEGVG